MAKPNSINNPHDKYFRAMMGYEEFSREFFQTHLPKSISDNIDYDSLHLLNETHLDKQLQKVVNDLLFTCKIKGKDAYLCLLVEHQSSADKFMAFRIYHYLFSLLNSELKQHPDRPLPPVYALLFYHGEQTPYPYSLNLLDSFEDPICIMQNTLFQPVPIVDVNQITDEKLQEQDWVGTLSMAMKYIRKPELAGYAINILKHLPELETQAASDMLTQLLVYLLNAGDIEDIDEFIEHCWELPQPVRSELMTTAERLEARGKAEGKAEGKTEEKIFIAKNLIREGADVAFVAKVTQLSIEEVTALKNQT